MNAEEIRLINEGAGYGFPRYYVLVLTLFFSTFFLYLERIKTERVLYLFIPSRVRNLISKGLQSESKDIKKWNLRIRGISLTHALVSTIFSLIILFSREIRQDPYSGKPDFWLIAASYSMGYFLWDLSIIIREWNQNKDSFVWFFHGFVSLISIMTSFFVPEQPLIKVLSLGIITEFSTVILSIRYCYHIIGDTTSFSCKLVSYIFLIAFFYTRNILLPYGLHTQMYNAFMFCPTLRSKWRIFIFFPIGELFNIMNIYWLYKVVNNVFNPKDVPDNSGKKESKPQFDDIDELQIPDSQDNILLDSRQNSSEAVTEKDSKKKQD
ncbi:transmembrane domain-containing protein [Cryptosporidium canis]|uniref:Transmembrane domain-containing protein n=1 Tax=Cryptosporidium canis TaxID=195482 RepID=A0A9D5DDU4_9CRYT|nr:transmembrane domain-containing protein [Cryptosporidium canis]